MPLLSVISVLAAKVEGTAGTAESLAQADANILARNISFTPTIAQFERNIRKGALSKHTNIPGSRMGEVTFEVDMYANGSTAPGYGKLLRACRFYEETVSATTVYTTKISPPTLTIGFYVNGTRHQIFGARGTGSLRLDAGKPGVWSFRFMGLLSDFSDTAILANTFPTNSDAPPIVASGAASLGGLSAAENVTESYTIDLGNVLTMRPDANAATGYLACEIVDSNPTLTFDPEDTLASAFNFQSIMAAGTSAAFAIAWGSSANKISIAAPTVQISQATPVDKNGIMTRNVTCPIRSNSVAGNDELVITLGS